MENSDSERIRRILRLRLRRHCHLSAAGSNSAKVPPDTTSDTDLAPASAFPAAEMAADMMKIVVEVGNLGSSWLVLD